MGRSPWMWPDDEGNLPPYEKAWDRLADYAVHGARAHRLIGRARATLNPS
ncbi:hypothetical protein ACGFSG_36045 [Streptomyces sp. NPDC048512]